MNYKTLTLTLLLGLATHTSLQAAEMMNHAGHDMGQMSQMEGMNEMAMTQGSSAASTHPRARWGSSTRRSPTSRCLP